MTMKEVIEKAKEVYPDLALKPASARTWTKRGLIPSPVIESLGRSRGTQAHYPNDSPAQMATAAYLQELGYTQKQIAQAREWILNGIPLGKPIDADSMDWTSPEVLEAMELPDMLSGPQARRLFRCLEAYAMTLAMARGGINLLRSLPSFVHKTVKPFSDRLEYIVSIPGAWIDPRHEGEGWLVSGHEQTRGTYFGDK
ncbi:hypothetical protein [Candidatus Darwinibacter acetoxidans]